MKGCLGPTIFVHRAEHIVSYLKLVNGTLYPDEFKNIINVSYTKYKLRASERSIDFMISQEFLEEKTKESCYLCGKMPSNTHKNGLDRIDNTLGYIEYNCKSCCANCNYIKRDNTYNEFTNKCMLIYYKHKKECKINVHEENRTIVKGNKLTSEEKKEKERIRKQVQRNALRNKYGDEEYKKLHAKTIADQRKKSKEND
jgi:hypothetical protein